MKKYLGYIEGYFGRELSWHQRFGIIDHLRKLKLDTYIYAPKEDPYHRVEWRKPYPKKQREKIRDFIQHGKKRDVEVVLAISPGLSYDYLLEKDYSVLIKKIRHFASLGSKTIALFMDDISFDLPDNSKNIFNSLGHVHGLLLKDLYNDLKDEDINLLFCPTLYSDQFVKRDATKEDYLVDLANNSPKEIKIFWTGPRVVSEKIDNKGCKNILKLFDNNIIFWDNLYANDYAPLRIFVGPYKGRSINTIKQSKGIMINPTGLYNTDKFVLSLYASFLKTGKSGIKEWEKVAEEFNISKQFYFVRKFFWNPYDKPELKDIDKGFQDNPSKMYNDLIVNWQNPLKLEWYSYLQSLYHDLFFRNAKKSDSSRVLWADIHYPPIIAEKMKAK